MMLIRMYVCIMGRRPCIANKPIVIVIVIVTAFCDTVLNIYMLDVRILPGKDWSSSQCQPSGLAVNLFEPMSWFLRSNNNTFGDCRMI